MKIVLVHGFNVKDKGANTVDKLAPLAELAGYTVDVDEGDYGHFSIWMVRLFKTWLRNRVIYRLAKAFETADVIITHSNGANFTTKALDLLPREYNNTKIVVHISPALNTDTDIPNAVKSQLVMYTPHDGWVKVSSYLPLHPWGRMGARGYTGTNNKNTNLMDARIKKHSDWFVVDFIESTWSQANGYIKEHAK